MNFHQVMRILLARRALALSIMLLNIVVAVTASLVLENSYRASASLVVHYKLLSNPLASQSIPAPMPSHYMATQVEILRSRQLALNVVDTLKLVTYPSLQSEFNEAATGESNMRAWLAEGLRHKLDVEPLRESNVINVRFNATSPDFAALVANAFVHAYLQANVAFKRVASFKPVFHTEAQREEWSDLSGQAQGKLPSGLHESGSLADNPRTGQKNEPELHSALANLPAHGRYPDHRGDVVGALIRQLDTLQNAYGVAAQWLAPTSLEPYLSEADAVVLDVAYAPVNPAGLHLWQIALLSLLSGVLMGAVCALLMESADRHIRSTNDLATTMNVPVLGVLRWTNPAPVASGMSGLVRMKRLFGG